MPRSIREFTKRHEGYRDTPYVCPAGFYTVGWGHNLEAHYPKSWEKMIGKKFEKKVLEDLLNRDLSEAAKSAKRCCQRYNVVFEELPRMVQSVLVCMCFQMGSVNWPKFMGALRERNWAQAKVEALDSKWAKKDTPRRAKELVEWLESSKKAE